MISLSNYLVRLLIISLFVDSILQIWILMFCVFDKLSF